MPEIYFALLFIGGTILLRPDAATDMIAIGIGVVLAAAVYALLRRN